MSSWNFSPNFLPYIMTGETEGVSKLKSCPHFLRHNSYMCLTIDENIELVVPSAAISAQTFLCTPCHSGVHSAAQGDDKIDKGANS